MVWGPSEEVLETPTSFSNYISLDIGGCMCSTAVGHLHEKKIFATGLTSRPFCDKRVGGKTEGHGQHTQTGRSEGLR